MTPPRVNGARHASPHPRRRLWRPWLARWWPAGASVAVLLAAGVTAVALGGPPQPPAPVSAAAGAQPGTVAVPTVPYTGGMEVREDGPTAALTKTGCQP